MAKLLILFAFALYVIGVTHATCKVKPKKVVCTGRSTFEELPAGHGSVERLIVMGRMTCLKEKQTDLKRLFPKLKEVSLPRSACR